MKKWVILLTVVAALGALAAGCQPNDSSATDKEAAANASNPSKMKPAAAPAGAAKPALAPPPP